MRRTLHSLLVVSLFFVMTASAFAARDVRTVLRHGPGGAEVIQEYASSEPTVPGAGRATLRGSEVVWQKTLVDAIYTTASIIGPDTSVCAGTYLNPPKEAELIPLDGLGVPDWVHAGNDFDVSASRNAEVVAATDFDGGTTVTVHKWSADSGVPDWSFAISPARQGQARSVAVSDDGSTIAVLVTMQSTPLRARLYYFDASSSSPLGAIDGDDSTFGRNLSISAQGDYIAFIGAANAYVVDRDAGALRWSGSMGASNDAIALSADGNRLAFGWSSLQMREWDGAAYAPLWSRSGGAFFLRSCEFSQDGGTFVAAWYRSDFVQNRVQVFGLSSTLIWGYRYPAATGSGYQDLPVDVAVTVDGQWIAVGSWGDEFDTNPEVHVFSRASSTPMFMVDTPGSIFDIDIASTPAGIFVAAGGKHIHANETGRGGDLFSIRLPDVVSSGEGVGRTVRALEVQPNPFRPQTTMTYSLARPGAVRLVGYDVRGRRVVTLVNERQPAGRHSLTWNGLDEGGAPLGAGVYFMRLEVGEEAHTRKITLRR
jgi:hypothetical protein